MEDDQQWKTSLYEKRPLMENKLWHKRTCIGRQPSIAEDLQWKFNYWWKRAFIWKWPLMEDNLRWPYMEDELGTKHPLIEDYLGWKMPYDWRPPSIEEDLSWKKTFNGRRTLQKEDLQRKITSPVPMCMHCLGQKMINNTYTHIFIIWTHTNKLK